MMMAYPLAMAKHTQEELESSMKGGPKLLSSWAINEFLVEVYFEPCIMGLLVLDLSFEA